MSSETVEGEVVEETGAEIQRSSAVVPAPPPSRSEVISPLDLGEVKGAMEKYQHGLRELLVEADWQGTPNQDGSFVKKSGWRKIATWFGLSLTLTTDEVERDEKGQILRAKVWARATAPNGRVADGDGYCSVDEPRFTNKDTHEPIDKARYKLENDLRATATTRAMNRAVSNLVGMGAVSAEEMEGVEPNSQAATKKQQDYALTLLGKANFDVAEKKAIWSWATADGKLQKSPASKIIESLKDGTNEGRNELLKLAGFSDTPGDESGLEPPAEGDAFAYQGDRDDG